MGYYNTTDLLNASNPLIYLREANNLSAGIAAHGLLIIFFLVVLFTALQVSNHFGKSLVVSGLASALISFLFVLAGLSVWYFPIFFAVVVVIGVIMLQDKDYGT